MQVPLISSSDFSTDHPHNLEACLAKVEIFSHFTQEDILNLNKGAQVLLYKKNRILYLRDDPAKFFYVICKGWIKLFQTSSDGEEIVFDMLTRGKTCGINAIFEKGAYTSSAQVVEDVTLLAISVHGFKAQIEQKPELMWGMLGAIYRQHRQRADKIILNYKLSAPQRIARFLLEIAPENQEQKIRFELPYEKTLIAQLLGMTRGSFSRALSRLKKEKLIRLNGMHVEIYSVKNLEQYVGIAFNLKGQAA